MSDTLATPDRNKEIYTSLDDRILEKRLASPYPIRRHAHTAQWQAFIDLIPPGSTVLDAGCGPGALSVMLAEHGCHVTGTDISEPNVIEARKYAEKKSCADRTEFRTADIEHMPFPDKSFDYVVSSHVLEHVPDFAKGASELSRLARKNVIIAIPTCVTLAGMTLLGGDNYWTFSRHSLYALPYGFLRVLVALFTGKEGVNEGYEGNMELIHIWRFPWAGKRRIEEGALKVTRYRASAIILPYFPFLLPLSRFLEQFAWAPILKECGCGTTYVCEPVAR